MANNYYRTAQLSTDWDLTLDANNNLAVATDKHAISQDIACTALTFSSEIIYDKTRGVEWKAIAGKTPSHGFITNQIKRETMRVQVVVDTVVHLDFDRENRTLYGVIVCEDTFGNTTKVNF